MLHRSFRAMGTEMELLLDADSNAPLAGAEEELRRLESLLSRFLPGSELSRLNAAGSLDVGPELLELAELALAARERTDGRFDPTVHDALVAAGYDRPFDLLDPASRPVDTPRARCAGAVAVDRHAGRIALEPGYRLDLGGIAKGWAADRVVAFLSESGPALVNAGGDVSAAGAAWPVGVETPAGTLTLELEAGGIATSGRDRRVWQRDGEERHHLIDPVTGEPATSDVLTVTVAATSAAEAEVLATSLFLAGSLERAAAEADAKAIPAVVVGAGGEVRLAGGLS
ncbi:MAG TPA: FAD:protein FMN transferase [Gaiella sp.]|jgi:thiamine biosynthesis lipoprotein|nr:FAD:protein FMN transferase [Gaiella sp.]HEU0056570.1 FAD:protein FMN transferase [Gaiella sp.]